MRRLTLSPPGYRSRSGRVPKFARIGRFGPAIPAPTVRCPSGTDAGQSVEKMWSLARSGATACAEPGPLVRALRPAARVCCGRLGLLAGALSGVGFLGCGARPVARLLGLPVAVLGREL
jgi:hypothetical protein